MTERWRAEMPRSWDNEDTAFDGYVCAEADVESLKDRANAELDAAEAERESLKNSLDVVRFILTTAIPETKDLSITEVCGGVLRKLEVLDAAETENRELREKVAGLELEAEAAHERIAALEAELATYEEPACNGSWVNGSGAHRKFGGCGKPASWRDDGGACFCDEHLPAHERIATLEAERDAAFQMSRCECASDEACRNLVAKDERIAVLESRIRDLEDDLGRIGEEMGLPRGIVPADGEFLRMRNLLRDSLQRIKELTEWRPMETAPRDGTLIVGELADGGFVVLELANESPEEWAWCDSEEGPFYGPEEIRRFVTLPLPSTEGATNEDS